MKKSWLLLIGLVFITCNTSEVKKTAPLEVVKAKANQANQSFYSDFLNGF